MEINSKIRRLMVYIDFSEMMKSDKIKPNLIFLTFEWIKNFINSYFISNPLSKLSIFLIKNQSLSNLTNFEHSQEEIIKIIKENFNLLKKNFEASLNKYLNLIEENHLKLEKNISLVSCLKYSLEIFKDMPNYYYKDILLITSSVSSIDNDDIIKYLKQLKQNNIILNSINILNEWVYLKDISNIYVFCRSKKEFENSFNLFIFPKNINLKENKFLEVYFPKEKDNINGIDYICSCHNKFIKNGHSCYNCLSINCQLDTKCSGCNYMLLSSYSIFNYYENKNIKFKKIKLNLEDKECSYCNLISSENFYNCNYCHKDCCEKCYNYILKVLKFCIYCQ